MRFNPRIVVIAVVLLVLTAGAVLLHRFRAPPPPENLPGVVRQKRNVFLIENHGTASIIWHAMGIRAATLVHVDTHDDCRYEPPEKLAELDRLFQARDYEAVFRRSDPHVNFQFKRQESEFLYHFGNFIYPCILDGTVSEVYWVVPDQKMTLELRLRLQRHLAKILRMDPPPFAHVLPHGGFSFELAGTPIHVLSLTELPKLTGNTLLDLDADFFAFPTAMSENHLKGALSWDPRTACRMMADNVPAPRAVTVCSSVWGGYLPMMLRFLPDAFFEFFVSGTYPAEADVLLERALRLQKDPRPIPLPEVVEGGRFEPARLHMKGIVLLMQGKINEGEALLLHAAQLQPVYRKALLDGARAFLWMKRPAEAHRMLNRFEELTGTQTTLSGAVRVRAWLQDNHVEKADALSQRLLAWQRDSYTLLLRAGVLTEKREYEEAERLSTESLKRSRGKPMSHYNLGLVLDRQGKIQEALAQYAMALRLNPNFADAHENLGQLLLALKRLDAAARHLSAAVRLNPLKVAAWNNLGLAFYRAGRFTEAATRFERALAINESIPETHANLGATLEASGRFKQALRHYERALELRPDWPKVSDMATRLRKRLTGKSR